MTDTIARATLTFEGDAWPYRAWETQAFDFIRETRLFAAIEQEAWQENSQRPAGEDTGERIARALGANDAQLAKLRTLVQDRRDAQREAETLRTRLAAAEGQITDGSDPRLTDFWERAQEQATDAGYCSEYDRMAEMLGGPQRRTPGHIHIAVTVHARVDVADVDDPEWDMEAARESAIEELRNGEGSFEEGETCRDDS
jgi:hypothetical protein